MYIAVMYINVRTMARDEGTSYYLARRTWTCTRGCWYGYRVRKQGDVYIAKVTQGQGKWTLVVFLLGVYRARQVSVPASWPLYPQAVDNSRIPNSRVEVERLKTVT